MAKKALIVWGGWNGHQPDQVAAIYDDALKSNGFDVEVSDTLDAYLDEEKLKGLDLIVPIWTMGKITNEQLNPLLNAVKSGVGLSGCHGGMCDSFRDATEYQFMTGGQWVAHPGNDGVEYTVRITDPNHFITQGSPREFPVKSEQYYMHVDPSNEVLATTTFSGEHTPWIEGAVVPVVWKRQWGRGRAFYSSLGHVVKDFEVPEAKTIVERGMLWASR